ncbi:exocyst complex component SEC3A isoform X2 [Daucus carota subsp. sativus]|uniref:exocyst complex component SEC3A isoform X2 n=1 Tax=Daucus carota subsp. sativus TaxID=79200 RepID=UPI0007EF2CC7|nr:PREDICTED: exocyst complex component SEC3A-like isoform X2 [Daucus carota subsp. sativus]
MRNIDDRNRLVMCIFNICKDVLGRLPKVVGIDVVEMALWAKDNTPAVSNQQNAQNGSQVEKVVGVEESDRKVTVERELVSQAEEDDMEALLGTYVMGIGEAEAFSERLKRELQALEAANVHAILESEPLIGEFFGYVTDQVFTSPQSSLRNLSCLLSLLEFSFSFQFVIDMKWKTNCILLSPD